MDRRIPREVCKVCLKPVAPRDLASHSHQEKNVDPVLPLTIAVDLAGKSFSADVDEVKEIVDDSQVSGTENLDAAAAAAVDPNRTSEENVDPVLPLTIAVDLAGKSFSADVDEVKEIVDDSQVSGTENLAAAAVDPNRTSDLYDENTVSTNADQASLNGADVALLAGAALKLKNKVDPLMQIDPKAENDYAGHTNWLKRAQLTLKPDEGSSSAVYVPVHIRASPLADVPAAVDLADSQFLYVASGEWLKRAVFALTTSVGISTVTDRQVSVEERPVSAEVARQWWLQKAGMCMVASIACLLKWKETLDAGVVENSNVGLASELGGEEERGPPGMTLAILNALTELKEKEDVLVFIEAAEAEYPKRNVKDDDL